MKIAGGPGFAKPWLSSPPLFENEDTMNASVDQLIHAYRGYACEAAGVISTFFSSPRQASDCAASLRAVVKSHVETGGTQLTVGL